MEESYFEPEYGLRQKLAQIHDQLDPVDEWREPILEAVESIPEWRSVADDFPPEYQTVLIAKAGVPWPITAFWTGQKWCRDVAKEEFHPTHWMPLPAPPSNDQAQGAGGGLIAGGSPGAAGCAAKPTE